MRKKISDDKNWLYKEFEKKIAALDGKAARRDVENFLRPEERKFIENWSEQFFHSQVEKIELV